MRAGRKLGCLVAVMAWQLLGCSGAERGPDPEPGPELTREDPRPEATEEQKMVSREVAAGDAAAVKVRSELFAVELAQMRLPKGAREDAQIKKWLEEEIPNYKSFLGLAVTIGLYLDHVPLETIKALASAKFGELWVAKCNICSATRSAMSDFKAPVEPFAGKSELPMPIVEGLKSTDKKKRRQALAQMLTRYNRWAWQLVELEPARRKQIAEAIRDEAAHSMNSLKPQSMESCPSCDGAAHAAPIL